MRAGASRHQVTVPELLIGVGLFGVFGLAAACATFVYRAFHEPTVGPVASQSEVARVFVTHGEDMPVAAASNTAAANRRRTVFGYCSGSGEGENANNDEKRAKLIARFTPSAGWRSTLYVGADARADHISTIRGNLPSVHKRVQDALGLSAEVPDVYLYGNTSQLRLATCAENLTVALYDGAIHLAPEGPRVFAPELIPSLTHEYVHHVLFRNAIRQPFWFHEGAAMLIARDPWSQWRLKARPVDPSRLVSPSFRALSPEQAETYYGQAYLMVRFLEHQCRAAHRALPRERNAFPSPENSLECSGAELSAALHSQRVKPQDLFFWGANRWTLNDSGQEAWLAYAANPT